MLESRILQKSHYLDLMKAQFSISRSKSFMPVNYATMLTIFPDEHIRSPPATQQKQPSSVGKKITKSEETILNTSNQQPSLLDNGIIENQHHAATFLPTRKYFIPELTWDFAQTKSP